MASIHLLWSEAVAIACSPLLFILCRFVTDAEQYLCWAHVQTLLAWVAVHPAWRKLYQWCQAVVDTLGFKLQSPT